MFGIRIRRVREEVLKKGDKMTLNVEQVDKYFTDPHTGNTDVIVEKIILHGDGTKEIWVKSFPKQIAP